MPTFVFTIALVLGASSVALAQRETSLRVVDALRDLHPSYRDLRNQVINAVVVAKLNTSDIVYEFQGQVATYKEGFLQSAIRAESDVLRQVNGQSVAVDISCLGFLRQSVDVNMNLAGVSFTNCLSTLDATLAAELTRVYAELTVNESSYINLSVYDVFPGQNVFVNPQTIIDRLVEKLSAVQDVPIELAQELAVLVDAFESRLRLVLSTYTVCLTANDELLQQTLNTVLVQLQQICRGTLVPAASSSEPEPTEPAETEPTETEPAPTEPAETEPTETEPAPTEGGETEPAPTETEAPAGPPNEPPIPDHVYVTLL